MLTSMRGGSPTQAVPLPGGVKPRTSGTRADLLGHAAQGVRADRLPGDFLEQAVELFGLGQLRQLPRHGQADRAAAVEHGEMAIGGEDPDVRPGMAQDVDEELILGADPGRRPFDHLGPQREDRLAARHHGDLGRGDEPVELTDMVLDQLEVGVVLGAQLGQGQLKDLMI